MLHYTVCISRLVAIDDVISINNLVDQGWEFATNNGDLHFMDVKLSKTFDVEVPHDDFMELYCSNLMKSPDFTFEWAEATK